MTFLGEGVGFLGGEWWVPHTPIPRLGLESNPHDILSEARNLSFACFVRLTGA